MSTILRFDLRCGPLSSSTIGELYAAALDMCEWGDAHGSLTAVFSEHHASPDGYLPSPIVMAAAAAARTTRLPINIGALLALMYDPVKLAEDMAVLDHLSDGRVSYTIGLGYRDAEYAMFGVDPTRRGAAMDEHIEVLRRALSGESFSWRDRSVDVRPRPLTPGGPPIGYGGGTPAAARHAARHGLAFLPQNSDPDLARAYDEAATAAGNPPGLTLGPPAGFPTAVFVSRDIDAAWDRLAPHVLHDAVAYDTWRTDAGLGSVFDVGVDPLETVRRSGDYRIVTPAGAVDLLEDVGVLALHPLVGGCPPAEGWQTLHLIETDVLGH